MNEGMYLREAEINRQNIQIDDKVILESKENRDFPYTIYKVRNVSYSTINGVFSKYEYKTLNNARNVAKYPKDGDFETTESPISKADFNELTTVKAIVR